MNPVHSESRLKKAPLKSFRTERGFCVSWKNPPSTEPQHDLGPLRNARTKGENMTISKNAVTVRMSLEEYYGNSWNPKHARKVERVIETPPTEEEWAEYRDALAAWNVLDGSPYFDSGCSCEYPSVNEPEPHREYVYAETEQEWIARCRAEGGRTEHPDWQRIFGSTEEGK